MSDESSSAISGLSVLGSDLMVTWSSPPFWRERLQEEKRKALSTNDALISRVLLSAVILSPSFGRGISRDVGNAHAASWHSGDKHVKEPRQCNQGRNISADPSRNCSAQDDKS